MLTLNKLIYKSIIKCLQDGSRRKRIKHDETTSEIKSVVEYLNQQFEGQFKVMVYWSRRAVGFLILKNGKFQQAW